MLPDIAIEFDVVFQLLRQTPAYIVLTKQQQKKRDKTKSIASVKSHH